MKKKYKRLITDMIIFGIGAIGSKLIMFLLLPLYTNVLSESEYGIADLVFTTGQLILPIISLAIFNGLLRYGLMKDQDQRDVLRCSTIVFVAGSVAAIIMTPLAAFYEPINQWKWYLCAYVISLFASSNTLVYLKVKNKNKAYAVLSIVQALVLIIANVVFLVILKYGIQGYLISTILSNTVTALFAFFIGDMHKDLAQSHYNKGLMKEIVLYSIPFIFNDISWWSINSSNKIMIEWMIGSSMLGIYAAASKIPSLINAVASIFSQAWGLSSIKEYDSSNETSFYSNVFQYFSIAIFGVCICVVTITKPFMQFYVGAEFYEAWHYVPALLVGATFSAISAFAGSMYGAMKKSSNIMTTTLVAGITNLVVNYIFIQILGVWGAVLGTVSAYVLIAVLRLADVHRFIKINYNIKRLVFLSVISLAQAILVGLDIYGTATSIVCILLFLLVARKDLVKIINLVLHRDKNRGHA